MTRVSTSNVARARFSRATTTGTNKTRKPSRVDASNATMPKTSARESVDVPALHARTPLIKSTPLSRVVGRDVHLKLESVQPSGSFKLRGIGRACALAVKRDGAPLLVSSSGGNAGLAVAHSGRELGVDVVVYVPETTPVRIQELLRSYDAEVVVAGKQWSEANEAALERAAATGGAMIHPFEGDDTWEGHSTLVDEIKEDLGRKPAAIVTCVGGGGLLAGCLRGVERNGWRDDVVVVAMETIGADSLNASMRAGELVTLPAITSVAKSLGAASPSPKVFQSCLELGHARVRSHVCEDADAVAACVQFADDHRILVEPACGAALSAAYFPQLGALDDLPEGDVVVVVCGGSVVNRESLAELADTFLYGRS